MLTIRQKVIWFAFISRIAVIILQAVANVLIPDHKATDVFLRPKQNTEHGGVLDRMVLFLLGGLERWDAHYFLHIAEHGYVFENTLAFFPLYPAVVRCLSHVVGVIFYGSLSQDSTILLSGTVLNIACFVKTSDVLYRLSVHVLKETAVAYKAALLFCVNPASIFFTAPYSEASFALLTFYGMLKCNEVDITKYCGIPFGLAAATRSNGILNIGFIVHSNVKQFLLVKWPILLKKRALNVVFPFQVVASFAPLIEATLLTLTPFIAFQIHCYYLFCTPQQFSVSPFLAEHAVSKGFVLPNLKLNETRPSSHWCNSKIPLAYSYVQNHYWNVGFLHYYQWKQLPNFLLALPIFLLVSTQTLSFLKQHSDVSIRLGLIHKHVSGKELRKTHRMSPDMFVFIAHVLFLTIFCLLCVHVQVTTRMICSASPVPYWFAAYLCSRQVEAKNDSREPAYLEGRRRIERQLKKLHLGESDDDSVQVLDSTESVQNRHSKWKVNILTCKPRTLAGKLVILYFFSYTIVGTVLFSNFLPWT